MTTELKLVLQQIARNLEQQSCPDCDGHNEHDYCRPPDVARAIREVIEWEETCYE